jgi:hypothetical protein
LPRRERGVAVTLLLQGRVEYLLLHYASRALYGQLLSAGVKIQEYHQSFLHAKVAVIDGQWGDGRIVEHRSVQPADGARGQRVRPRPGLRDQLREELARMIDDGARRVRPQHWALRPRPYKALVWTAYGIVRVAWACSATAATNGSAAPQEAARMAAAAPRRDLSFGGESPPFAKLIPTVSRARRSP